jgi:probable F420-dependent oxidoreductase
MDIGAAGLWTFALDLQRAADARRVAAAIEEQGWGALWIPEAVGREALSHAGVLLDATERLVVATGVINVYGRLPTVTAGAQRMLADDSDGRFLLGLGVSHEPAVTNSGQVYERPLAKMRAFLDALDAATPAVPAGERMLAALGPRMLELARDRTSGAHPYLVTPDHTATARAVLGDGPLLATEVMVVLDDDAERARAVARQHLSRYMVLPNYTNNFLRHGFTEMDLLDGGSDRLVDGLIPWGDVDTIAARIGEHHSAGADHVCIQVLQADAAALPRDAWRRLAAAML